MKRQNHKRDAQKPGEGKKKPAGNGEVFRALGLLTQLGLSMAACLMAGVLLGNFLDGKLGTSPWLLLLFSLLGVAGAFKVLYDIAMKEWL